MAKTKNSDDAKMTKVLKAHLTKLLKENQEQQKTLAAEAQTLKQRLDELAASELAKEGIVLIRVWEVQAGKNGDEIRTRDGKGWTRVLGIVRHRAGATGSRTFNTAERDERWFGNSEKLQVRPGKSLTKK